MPDDEPLDDARAVAMAGAAAAAKIVETAARAAQDHRARQQRQPTPEQPYDSTQRRQQTDRTMQAAGVADEPRAARATADLLNGTDPRTAAASGKATRARPARTTKSPEPVRTR